MKRLTLILLLSTVILLSQSTSIQATFRFTFDTRETQYHRGIRHSEYIGSINYNGTETMQKINYMGANPTKSDNLHVVVGDNYLDYDWGKGTLTQIISNVNTTYSNYDVIGGVNGDFYGANGIPIEAYVRNFEVLSWGLGTNRTVIGFKDNGEVLFGRPCFEGYEAIVYNSNDQVKHRFPIERINQYPVYSGGVSAFFPTYDLTISGAYNKVMLDALEYKLDEYGRTYFGKGVYQDETTFDITAEDYHLVLIGDTLNSDDLITTGDTVVVQQKMACDWENVRFAIGGWETLVQDGIATEEHTEGAGPTYRHPRTAIGVKADGTIFFVTVDGRDYENGYLGVTAYELSEIMIYFDAVHAYNLDGGGSTTMVLENEIGEYVYLNTPSDGHPRSVSNGLFFVEGTHLPRAPELPYPDTRTTLDHPSNSSFDATHRLTFDPVEHASSYTISVDGDFVTVLTPEVGLDLTPGLHLIQIKANGDYTDYKDSTYSPIILYMVYDDRMQDIIDLLHNMAKK